MKAFRVDIAGGIKITQVGGITFLPNGLIQYLITGATGSKSRTESAIEIGRAFFKGYEEAFDFAKKNHEQLIEQKTNELNIAYENYRNFLRTETKEEVAA